MGAVEETWMSHDVPVQYESLIRLPCSGQENTERDGDPYLSLEFDKSLGVICIYKDINME